MGLVRRFLDWFFRPLDQVVADTAEDRRLRDLDEGGSYF